MTPTQHHNDDTELRKSIRSMFMNEKKNLWRHDWQDDEQVTPNYEDDLVELFHQYAHKYAEEVIGEGRQLLIMSDDSHLWNGSYADVSEQRQRNNERKGRAA